MHVVTLLYMYFEYLVQFIDTLNQLVKQQCLCVPILVHCLSTKVPHRLSIWSNLHYAACGLGPLESHIIISRLKQD